MLVAAFRDSLGKSSHGGEILYNHIMACVSIAHRLLSDSRFVPASYPKQKRDQLLHATFVHDVGKLDPAFQTMLHAARDGRPLPSKRIKHEASTLNFDVLLAEGQHEVREHLSDVLGYRSTEAIDPDDALAFAVTHHGLFYLSFEERDGQVVRRIRRQWTVFNYGERRRITLADLLFDYHPLGGLVIIADLLGSFCYEQGIANVDEIIGQARSLRELMDGLLRQGTAEAVERKMQEYDPRSYGLRDLLTLLTGGLA